MRRHDIRLKRFDYRSPGMYLVTLVTDHRQRVLAKIDEGGVVLLDPGNTVARHLVMLTTWRPTVHVIGQAIMPDHVHLILRFTDSVPAGLGAVVNALKGGITREINSCRGTEGAVFWQRNFWERIVRSEEELRHYRRYFDENPRRWLEKYGPG